MMSLKSLASGFATLVLFACAAPEVKAPISAEQKHAAAQYVLKHAYQVQAVAQFCQRLSRETTAQARQIEQAWQSQNWGYVDVAHQAYAVQYQQDSRAFGELAALYSPIELYLAAEAELNPKMMPIKRDFAARDQRCLRLLNTVIAQEPSYLAHAEHGAALAELAKQHTQAQAPFAVLLDYKQSYNPSARLLGDSVFKAQGLLQGQCSALKAYTLEHKGHNNTVLGRCDDGRLLAARCDIGGCKLVP